MKYMLDFDSNIESMILRNFIEKYGTDYAQTKIDPFYQNEENDYKMAKSRKWLVIIEG